MTVRPVPRAQIASAVTALRLSRLAVVGPGTVVHCALDATASDKASEDEPLMVGGLRGPLSLEHLRNGLKRIVIPTAVSEHVLSSACAPAGGTLCSSTL